MKSTPTKMTRKPKAAPGVRQTRKAFEQDWNARNPLKTRVVKQWFKRSQVKGLSYEDRVVDQDWAAFSNGSAWQSTQRPTRLELTRRAARKAFEHYWQARHPLDTYPRALWLRRDTVWGRGGYRPPTVHFMWVAFLAGVHWCRALGA
jgi:hypothetical protein